MDGHRRKKGTRCLIFALEKPASGAWTCIFNPQTASPDHYLSFRSQTPDGNQQVGISIPGTALSVHRLDVPQKCKSLRAFAFGQSAEARSKLRVVALIPPGAIGDLIWRCWRLVGAIMSRLRRNSLETYVAKQPKIESSKVASEGACEKLDSPVVWSEVSIVIPSRDKPEHLTALWHAGLSSVCSQGAQVIIVDHASEMPATAKTLMDLAEQGVQVVRAEGPFNFSRLINFGVKASDRPQLVLLNDDVAPTSIDAFRTLLRTSKAFPNRISGGVLVYPQGGVQHAGLVLGMGGLVGHFGRGLPIESTLMEAWIKPHRAVSAVTGAVMALSRNLFDQLYGFDEGLFVECGDVDLCLRAAALTTESCILVGDSIWTHPEMSSRGNPSRGPFARRIQIDRAKFMIRWGQALACDPFLDRHLRRDSEMPKHAWPSFRGE
jgi:hypothetical protein